MRHGRGGADRPKRRQNVRGTAAFRYSHLRAGAKYRAHPGGTPAHAALPVRCDRLSAIGSGLNIRNLRLLVLLAGVLPVLYGCVAAVVGGAGTAALIAEDRRTVGTVTEDEGIELKARSRIDEKFRDSHINITSFNRSVL